jgi:hypothetical protein
MGPLSGVVKHRLNICQIAPEPVVVADGQSGMLKTGRLIGFDQIRTHISHRHVIISETAENSCHSLLSRKPVKLISRSCELRHSPKKRPTSRPDQHKAREQSEHCQHPGADRLQQLLPLDPFGFAVSQDHLLQGVTDNAKGDNLEVEGKVKLMTS